MYADFLTAPLDIWTPLLVSTEEQGAQTAKQGIFKTPTANFLYVSGSFDFWVSANSKPNNGSS